MADSGCFPPAAGKGVESRATRSSVCCLRSVTSKHLFRRLESVHRLYHCTALLRRACQPRAASCKPPTPRCWLEGAPAHWVITSGTSEDLAISLSVCLSVLRSGCLYERPRRRKPHRLELAESSSAMSQEFGGAFPVAFWGTAQLLGAPLELSSPPSEHGDP